MRVEEVLKKFGMMAERHLEQILDRADIRPEILDRAIRYSLFSGGKRIRPVLAMMCCEAAGGDAENALVPGLLCRDGPLLLVDTRRSAVYGR